MYVFTSHALGFKFTSKVCREYGLGKNWYCEKEKEKKADDVMSIQELLEMDIAGEEKAELLNEVWDLYRKRAVMSGEREDLMKFLEVQHVIARKGTDFGRNLQKIVDREPKYSNTDSDYKIATDEVIRDAEIDYYLKLGSKRYVLVFVHNADCTHCVRQLPFILNFKEKWGFGNLGVTASNQYFSELDENVRDEGIIKDEAIRSYPTLLLLDTKEREKIFLTRGLTILSEIEKRATEIIKERA